MDKDYAIYKDEKPITLDEALSLLEFGEEELMFVGIGKRVKSNPWYVIRILDMLTTSNRIDSFAYVGKELEQFPVKEGVVF